ncbi:thioredoxin domain-containing protein [Halorientalis brevis]|uniref:Thioredoxin domain-containing protein n=1 Tax=Halorientalis brevis TaxID=1126241 RepID=A0ABD6CHZ3_9EURY|nr:thioredoxin domain-containing protein [Halorientalis brevis]
MTDGPPPTERNRLDEEESPYLRQHADNPVNWQPWDDAALMAAQARDVPIFLSIGYSACHWCHVMEDESFEDEEIARQLNEHFVPIKVDREERPDVDSIYQTICQMTSGRGGWPLSAWLTPEGKPFFVGTYFPKEPKRGQPGFGDLLDRIHRSWETDRDELEDRAEQWTQAVKGELEETPDPADEAPDETMLDAAAQAAVRGADRQDGGWGRGPKFPQTGRIHILLRAHERTGRDDYRDVAEEALDAMVDGGLYDHAGGGFHRYCTDRDWTVPHFEKMLYDNAEITRALLAGYQALGTERYREVARETFAFVERELTHEDGGFFSTLDAQSEGEAGADEEGAFYVWTPGEVHDAVADQTDADLFCDRFGVTESGNFEGQTVLTVAAGISELAEDYDVDESEVEDRLETAREQVFEARAERPRPARDEKVLASWNGLMISAFAEGALVIGDSEGRSPSGNRPQADNDGLAETGADALAFVREQLWDADAGRLSRRYKDGDVKVDGYLEDYAFLARGAFDLYQATGDVDHLGFALDLARTIEADFWDEDAGTLYFTPADGEDLVARPQELNDQSTPSSAGVAAELLLALDHFVPREGFAEIAEQVLETHGGSIESNPLQHASLVLAADQYASGARELTVAADGLPDAWRAAVGDSYVPGRVLSVRPPTDELLQDWLDSLHLDAAPPIWADRERRDGEPTVYACQQFTCSPPRHEIDAALDWFDGTED